LRRGNPDGTLRSVDLKEQSNILVVDDRPENLLALRTVLDDPGRRIFEAQSGKEALRLLLQEEVDLVLLDVNMPVMDGFETAHLIRQRKPAELLPILFISAREPTEADRRQGYALGAIDYLIKPVVPDILRAKVSALLDLQRRATFLETAVQERNAELQSLNERAAKLRDVVDELESFSYSVSHDMRSPLRAIQGFAQILEDDQGNQLSEDGKELVRRIIASSCRLDKMITDVLAYSRMNVTPIAKERVEVEKIVRTIIDHTSELQPRNAEIQIRSPLLNVVGHPSSLTQCISNLLVNAVKFVAPGVRPSVQIWTEAVDAQVRLSIQDNGIGIAPEDQQRIFEAFARLNTAYEGTGFGLAIVRRAVERMGGKFGLESKLGEGSKFWIQLPMGEGKS
jgi:signal transduction histidine kinase